MQPGIEGPLGRHRPRDVAHVKNLTLCYKHFIANYPVIVCQVCFRKGGRKKRKTVCVSPIQRNSAVHAPRFSIRALTHTHARASVRESFSLWQPMKSLAGVTGGGRSSLRIQSKTLIVTFYPIKGLKWKPDAEQNLVTMRTMFLQIPLFCSLATARLQTGCRSTRTIYTLQNAKTLGKK